jgi:glycosyltransferase involved in cell wall biosynthesis
LHVVVAGEIGGAEHMLVDLASGRDDHAVALLTPSPALAHLFADAGMRVHDPGRVPEGPITFLRSSLGEKVVAWIAGILRQERATVAHLHTFASQVAGTRAALRAGIRVLRTEHSTRVYDDPSCWPFSRWSLRRVHASAAVSQHVRARALARAPWAAAKMQVVYDGVDPAHFCPAPNDADPSSFRFAMVGRLDPRKGVDLALQALALVPDAHLDVVGDGRERAALWSRAIALGVYGRVVFHGHLADPRPVVARASAILSASRTEGLGVSILEGMAMQKPAVAFAVGGVPEVVLHGKTGLLAEPGRIDALAARMREAMSPGAPLAAWGEEARARVVQRFSVQAMREGYDRLYAALAEDG